MSNRPKLSKITLVTSSLSPCLEITVRSRYGPGVATCAITTPQEAINLATSLLTWARQETLRRADRRQAARRIPA